MKIGSEECQQRANACWEQQLQMQCMTTDDDMLYEDETL
jgi:hypothetical protein